MRKSMVKWEFDNLLELTYKDGYVDMQAWCDFIVKAIEAKYKVALDEHSRWEVK